MKTTIKIKNTGNAVGTVGDLVRGLESGEYFFEEGICARDNSLGLWINVLSDKKRRQCVAVYNPFCLDRVEGSYNPFRFALSESVMGDERVNGWTNAAWEAICEVATRWCEARNRELDEEQKPKIHLVRVS